jgi:hypothetical protein
MAMITGTLADTIKPADSLPPEYMFDPEEDLVIQDLWEGYDIATRRNNKLKLDEAVSKSTCVFKFFIDTVDHPEQRNYENFCNSGYNVADLTRQDWNNNSFAAKKLTVDELKARVSKAEAKGNYSTPIATASGQKIDPANDTREEFNDEESENDSADTKLLRSIRASIDEFDSKERSLEEIVHAKFDKVYQTAERVASGRSLKQYAFIYGMAGIGKSYTVASAVKHGVERWRGQGPKPEIVSYHGAIGNSPTPLVVFFFQNCKHRVVVLDDADGFVKSSNEDTQNILKCLMDPEGFALTIPATIHQGANKLFRKQMGLEETLQAKLKEEEKGVRFTVDVSKVDEGVARVNIGGLTYSFNVNEEEAKTLKENFPPHKVTDKERNTFKRFKEALKGNYYDESGKLLSLKEGDTDAFINGLDLDDITGDTLAVGMVNRDGDLVDDLPTELPKSFYFTSSMIMISNLNRDDLNDAIQSRCDCIPIYLNRDEFMFRAEEVLNFIKVSKTTLTEPELVDWAKKESFALFKACMNDLKYKNSKINLRIGIPLELRIIASLAGLLLARFDAWCEKNNITDYIKPEVFQRFEAEQKVYFIKYDLIPYMAGDLNVDYSSN